MKDGVAVGCERVDGIPFFEMPPEASYSSKWTFRLKEMMNLGIA
jgi:hypothetical protein